MSIWKRIGKNKSSPHSVTYTYQNRKNKTKFKTAKFHYFDGYGSVMRGSNRYTIKKNK